MQGMHEYIDGFQTRLNEIGAAIGEDFFTIAQGSKETLPQSQRQTNTA
jgi:hypothetical protein